MLTLKHMKTDSATAAKLAGLKISDREKAGITREKVDVPAKGDEGKASFRWDYFLPDGKRLEDEERITSINSLAVPPAWTEVWFCPDKKGHIQATGKDDKGRLQYRYHPKWNEIKADLKYANVDEFALALPDLRDRVDADLECRNAVRFAFPEKHRSEPVVIRSKPLKSWQCDTPFGPLEPSPSAPTHRRTQIIREAPGPIRRHGRG